MTSFYLGLALFIAITLNHRIAVIRAAGTLVAATAMAFMAWSIVLANQDGTFASAPPGSRTPLLLNIEGVLLVIGVAVLLWSIPHNLRRKTSDPLPVRNTPLAYGHVTRFLHWTSAVLIIAAFTMGQFLGVLAPDAPPRAEFLGVHTAIGGAILLIAFARMFERLVRPSPPTTVPAHAGHFLLYALITAFCVTGLAVADAPVSLLGLKLPNLPADPIAALLHRLILPALFGLLFAAHIYGAVRAIRRMAR